MIPKELQEAARRDDRRITGAGGWWCVFGIHRWSRWSIPEKRRVSRYADGVSDMFAMMQGRACARCGKQAARRVGKRWNDD